MPNHKRKVSHIDCFEVYSYFQRAIQNGRLINQNEDELFQTRAIKSFSEIRMEIMNDETVKRLQDWIDEFVDSKTWGRCGRLLNQKKYLAKNTFHAVNLTLQAYEALKDFTENQKKNLSDAIILLLEAYEALETSTEKQKTGNSLEVFAKDSAHIGNNVVSLFKDSPPTPTMQEEEEELDSSLDSEFWDLVPEYPKKPYGYDFKKNESYKRYRKRIKEWTVKEINEDLLMYFDKRFTFNYYLTPETADRIGGDMLELREQLLEEKYFSKQFLVNDFGISKAISLPKHQLDAYADDLMFYIGLIFGCHAVDITSGNRTPSVFAGNKNHVQIAYKTFNYLNAFLSEEMDNFLQKCHKNTKKKNRYQRAGWHCDSLVSKMINNILDDDENYKCYSNAEEEALSQYIHLRVDLYFDENEPIGGWRD